MQTQLFDNAYPESRIKDTESFLRKVWAGKEKTAFSAYVSEPYYRQLTDMTDMVEKAAQNILLGASVPGFNIPRLIADFGTISTAAYWGGEVITPVGGFVSIKPVIETSEDLSHVKPTIASGGDALKGVNLWRSVSAKLNTSRLPCSFVDIQGPLNTAALLWKQDEFMMAMYTEPEAVHALLETVTEQIIQVVKVMKAQIGNMSGPLWPFIWLPSDIGIGMTEDYMPLISPEMYKEFGIPYVEKISKEFGGVFLHCCGKYEHQIENLVNSKINILGLEFHYPYMKPEILFNAFGSSAVFVPMLGPHGIDEFPDTADYLLYLKSKRLKETRLWPILRPEDQSFLKQVEIMEGMI